MKKILSFSIVVCLATTTFAQTKHVANGVLYKEFQNPGNAARPRVWWHWMNGNITKDGIRKDLLWMQRSGIGGFQNFDAALQTPQIVEKRLVYMTPEWKDAFGFAARLADSLKLEMAIAGSPGWSESGGPWVRPEDGMKKIVWTEVRVKGGMAFGGRLPRPAATTGTFQNLPIPNEGISLSAPTAAPPEYYQDIAVIAYKLPAAVVSLQDLAPKITTNAGNFTLAQLIDGDLASTNLLPSDSAKGFAWIRYEFAQPQTIKAVTVVGGGDRGPFGLFGDKAEDRSLEASDDGENFRRITFIPVGDVLQQTLGITPTTAKYFRVTFKNPPAPPNLGASFGFADGEAPKAPKGTEVAEVVLHPNAVIDRFEEKAGYAPYSEKHPLTKADASEAVAVSDIVDLTGKMGADGSLDWTPPAGNWKVLRFGYSLTGKQNHPAPAEATGLEVDKMDADAVKRYFENYLEQYKSASKGLMGVKGLQYMITDSYEAGQENWTPKMAVEFQKRRGYSLLPWMPVLTGQMVKTADESEKFLWDYRKTISELVAENHYDQLTTILAKYGMKRYTESHENGRVYIVDGMDVKRTAAVPMSAWWTPGGIGGGQEMHKADVRESASVAHIYGQNLVAAESLTAFGLMGNAWSYSPEKLKPVADLELASGLNRFVIHTSVHQPVDDKIPGLGLGPFGQWFNRHETWAAQAKAWTDYLARSSYMLQQGKFAADVVYYYGEDNNITNLFNKKMPDVPQGYNFDFINPHALINLLSVKDGKLVTPSGMSYRVLVLDSNAKKMSLPVLRKIAALVKAGATISGVKPEMTPSLNDDQQEFRRLVDDVWEAKRSSLAAAHGNVYTGRTIAQVLTDIGVQPDFEYGKPQSGAEMLFVHRRLPGSDIYWVNSRSDKAETIQATFRVVDKTPQIWHPETGKTEPASYQIANGRTAVSLNLAPNDAVFVVFETPATKTAVTLPAKAEKEVATVDGAWTVSFQPNRGAPATATFDKLASYTENGDAGIKYFSGTATYTKTVNVPAGALAKGAQVWIDLGEVKNLAEVSVNGKPLGVVWKQPFRVDATGALKAGDNKVDVKVVNLWVNRLIGDAQPAAKQKITYTTMPFYNAKSPLQPSGLLGPVKIIAVTGK
jgi:hypothetical protein